jgi:hypothetical protein
MPCCALYIHSDDNQSTLILFFDPIHDGFHCCACNSVRRLELEQDGLSLPDRLLDLGDIQHGSALAWMEKYPRPHQSNHQEAKGCNLGPFGSSPQQNYPGCDQHENCDPHC